jgi:predicted CXXCH cytochrome family protein
LLPFSSDPQSPTTNSRSCAECHSKIYETYRQTGMGRSFYTPDAGNTAGGSYYHPASQTWFTNLERGGRYYQRRYQIGFGGGETNIDEKEINFVLGSGNHVRTYLSRTNSGALLELPLAWYAEEGGHWGMNPGYDKPDQPNARRRISLDCVFCHNAYPQVREGHGQRQAEPQFRGPLSQGIDCQRCHGAGDRHIQLARTAGSTAVAIAGAIVNPARLPPGRRMEVCLQCHLETDSMPFARSILKYDRGQFSYDPGEPLGNFLLFFDHAPASPPEDRFQIVSSAYRLEMSACFRKSNGALQCTSCHNPHDVPRGEEASKIYNRACLGCHTTPLRQAAATGSHTSETNCVACHMPKRRTADVVHAVMTDHFIQRAPKANLLAPISEPNGPDTVYHGEVVPYYPKPWEKSSANELYLAIAQVREGNNLKAGVGRLAAAIAASHPRQAEFYIELGDALRSQGKPREAIAQYREAIRRKPDSLAALLGLGRSLGKAGQLAEAADAFLRATQALPDDASAWLELGQTYVKQGRRQDAVAALEKSVQLDSESPEAHYAIGLAAQREASFREAIRLRPDDPEANMNLAILLAGQQRMEEAGFHFETALRYHPEYALGHLNYGLMLMGLKRTTEAGQHLKQAAASTDPVTRQKALRLLAELGSPR